MSIEARVIDSGWDMIADIFLRIVLNLRAHRRAMFLYDVKMKPKKFSVSLTVSFPLTTNLPTMRGT